MWDEGACADLGARDDCGVERLEDERAFVGKFVTSSMSISSGVAAGAGPPRVMSPDRLMEYCFETSLAWIDRGIKTQRERGRERGEDCRVNTSSGWGVNQGFSVKERD